MGEVKLQSGTYRPIYNADFDIGWNSINRILNRFRLLTILNSLDTFCLSQQDIWEELDQVEKSIFFSYFDAINYYSCGQLK